MGKHGDIAWLVKRYRNKLICLLIANWLIIDWVADTLTQTLTHSPTDYITYLTIYAPNDWLLIDWPLDRRIHWRTEWLSEKVILTDQMTDGFDDYPTSLTDWLIDYDWQIDLLAYKVCDWLSDHDLLTNWPTDWVSDWVTDWVTDWLTE